MDIKTDVGELISRQKGTMSARIIDSRTGLKVLTNVKAIRIHSEDYTLLIMEDYTPSIGQIDGDVFFVTDGGELSYKGVYGFYKNLSNEFTLILQEKERVK